MRKHIHLCIELCDAAAESNILVLDEFNFLRAIYNMKRAAVACIRFFFSALLYRIEAQISRQTKEAKKRVQHYNMCCMLR